MAFEVGNQAAHFDPGLPAWRLGRVVTAGGGPAAAAMVRAARDIGEHWLSGWDDVDWDGLAGVVEMWSDVPSLQRAVSIVESIRDVLAVFIASGGLRGRGLSGVVTGRDWYICFTIALAAVYHGCRSRLAELSTVAADQASAAA
jgi:hypothetical protein